MLTILSDQNKFCSDSEAQYIHYAHAPLEHYASMSLGLSTVMKLFVLSISSKQESNSRKPNK